MTEALWGPFLLSLRLGALSTVLLLALCLPLCAWAARSSSWAARVVRACLQLPLVLPPTVLGFYLVAWLSPERLPGRFLRESLGIDLLFTFQGLVLAAMITGLPFMSAPLLAGFEALPRRLSEASWCLGRSRWRTFLRIELPLLRPQLFAGCILAFLHGLGEFGVVLMIGGKIPGETRTASIALYDLVETMDYAAAHRAAALLAALSFAGLVALLTLRGRAPGRG